MECGYGRSRTSPRTGPARPGGAHGKKKRRENDVPRPPVPPCPEDRHRRRHSLPWPRARARVYVAGPINFRRFTTATCAAGPYLRLPRSLLARSHLSASFRRGKQRTRVSWEDDSRNRGRHGAPSFLAVGCPLRFNGNALSLSDF